MALLSLLCLVLSLACTWCFHMEDAKIFAHRGGIRRLVPASSVLSFAIGAQQNADYLELDIGSSKDGELMVFHDTTLDEMTDIADHPEFADRVDSYNFSCKEPNPHQPSRYKYYCHRTGYHLFNFTLAELKTLKLRAHSPFNTVHNPLNDQFEILTFREFLYLVNNLSVALDRPIGITPELKWSTLYRSVGLDMSTRYMQLLFETGFVHKDSGYYETRYFSKETENDTQLWPYVIVQCDSPTVLNIIGNLSQNIYSAERVEEHVPLQFAGVSTDDLDWRLLDWITTFAGGLNLKWTHVDAFYDLVQKNGNISMNVHFRLDDFVAGTAQYTEKYVRNQYIMGLHYRALYGLDAIFSDNVQDLKTLIAMIKEFANSTSLLYTTAPELIDSDAMIEGLGVQCEPQQRDNSFTVLLVFVIILSILYIITVIGFIWIYKRTKQSYTETDSE